MKRKLIFILLLPVYFLAANVNAQPFNLDTSVHTVEIKMRPFNPKGMEEKKGRLGIVMVTQVKDTAYFFCKGLSIYSPVIAEVYKGNPAQTMQVSLHKWNWKEASRKGTTDEKGLWMEKFKSENDFGIMVVKKGGAAVYNLFVWAGEELKLNLTSPFVTYEEYEKGVSKPANEKTAEKKSKKNNTLLYIIGGVALAVFAAFVVLRKNKGKKGLMILFLFISFSIANGQNIGDMIDETLEKLNVAREGATPLNPEDFVRQPSDPEHESLTANFSRFQSALSAVNTGLELLSTAMNIYASAIDFYSALTVLDNGECTPDFSQSAEAMIPSNCLGNNDCMACYNDAMKKLDGNRQSLARMMCIYTNTKNYKDMAIALGNSIAGIPGAGFGWGPAKRTIEGSYENFKRTYDRKYQEFMTAVHEALTKISNCEQRYGMRDWYRRFGFMYFEFLQQKYKRTD
jgi:hypothetical protein